MTRIQQLALAAGVVVLGLLFLILLNSGLGVDSDETLRDLERPEIVGARAARAP